MLVLTGINFSKRNELYEDTKRSLQKFVSGIMVENPRTESVTAVNKNKLFGDNFMQQTYSGHVQLSKLSRVSNRIGTLQYNNNEGLLKKINQVRANGKTLLCYSCGSYRHLLSECPDSWENLKNKNNSKRDLKSMFPCVKDRICSVDEMAWS